MVSNGELASDDGTYALAGGLLERRQRVDEASRIDDQAAPPWDGTWELAVVSLERRSAADRVALRKAAIALHLAELREGVWFRPDNLDPDRLPGLRAVLDRQCVHFHDAATDIPAETVRSLFSLDDWAADARRLTLAVRDELDAEAVAADDFTYRFGLSSPWSAIFNSIHSCPSNSSRRNGRGRICAAHTVASTRCSRND